MTRDEYINQELAARAAADLDEINMDQAYDEALDECYSFADVGGPFTYMAPSKVLKECDPTAYRCGFSDFLDTESERVEEIGECYYIRDDVEALRETLGEEWDVEQAEGA